MIVLCYTQRMTNCLKLNNKSNQKQNIYNNNQAKETKKMFEKNNKIIIIKPMKNKTKETS